MFDFLFEISVKKSAAVGEDVSRVKAIVSYMAESCLALPLAD
jgi:hypothetical protein